MNLCTELSNQNTINISSKPICRICQIEDDDQAPFDHFSIESPSFSKSRELISPCLCNGSMQFVHNECLQRWVNVSQSKSCELCKCPYKMKVSLKSIWQWEALTLSPRERRRIIFSVIFHSIAMICSIWSLYVLSDRVISEIKNKDLSWPLWTKVLVIAIGFAGTVIFTYVQFRIYFALLKRWMLHNQKLIFASLTEAEIAHARSLQAKIHSTGKRTVLSPQNSFQEQQPSSNVNSSQSENVYDSAGFTPQVVFVNEQNIASIKKMRYLMSRLIGLSSINQVKQTPVSLSSLSVEESSRGGLVRTRSVPNLSQSPMIQRFRRNSECFDHQHQRSTDNDFSVTDTQSERF